MISLRFEMKETDNGEQLQVSMQNPKHLPDNDIRFAYGKLALNYAAQIAEAGLISGNAPMGEDAGATLHIVNSQAEIDALSPNDYEDDEDYECDEFVDYSTEFSMPEEDTVIDFNQSSGFSTDVVVTEPTVSPTRMSVGFVLETDNDHNAFGGLGKPSVAAATLVHSALMKARQKVAA